MKRRQTPSKEAIFDLLLGSEQALSREAIEQKITVEIDRATIYRILNRLCEDGLVHKIVAEDGKQYFAICVKCEDKPTTDHHFHFRCIKCQTIECLSEVVHFSVPDGYSVESVNCVLTGTCKKCSD